jgi:hypothetical protein
MNGDVTIGDVAALRLMPARRDDQTGAIVTPGYVVCMHVCACDGSDPIDDVGIDRHAFVKFTSRDSAQLAMEVFCY